MTFRFNVLTAVSKESQVEDKDSLDDQLKNACLFGETAGGQFVKEYRIDGYSRSGYYDLTKAFENIPELGELSRSVTSQKADVIIVDSFDRLGSVALAMWEWLKPYRIQLRSFQQPTPFFPPAAYEWRNDNGTYKMIVMSLLDQEYRIGKIVRAFAIGNPKRARDGKYSILVPYGYIKIDKSTVQIDETVAPLLIRFKDWFLSGDSLREIARRANASGVPPHKGQAWHMNIVRYILNNPFYAGKTFFARGYRNKHGTYFPKDNPELHNGNHEALWTYETFLQIRQEFQRRNRIRTVPADYNFTGLLKCSECGNTLIITHGGKDKQILYWYCKGHVSLRSDLANKLVADELTRLYSRKTLAPTKVQERSRVQKGLNSIEHQIRRLDAAFRAGSHTPEAYAIERQSLLAKQIDLLDEQKQEEETKRRNAQREQDYQTMADILPNVDRWIIKKPQAVKLHLSRTVSLTAFPDKTIQAEFI